MSRDEALSRVLGRPLRFAPGTDYGYSDAGYTLAAAVIEDVADRPFENFLRERVLEPGGMALTARVPVHIVAARLGDHPKTILDTYAHLLPQSDELAAERLAAALAE
jgi:CubicO group peptidase (beta-lactamase class C family)